MNASSIIDNNFFIQRTPNSWNFKKMSEFLQTRVAKLAALAYGISTLTLGVLSATCTAKLQKMQQLENRHLIRQYYLFNNQKVKNKLVFENQDLRKHPSVLAISDIRFGICTVSLSVQLGEVATIALREEIEKEAAEFCRTATIDQIKNEILNADTEISVYKRKISALSPIAKITTAAAKYLPLLIGGATFWMVSRT